jgi:hypothetical protein
LTNDGTITLDQGTLVATSLTNNGTIRGSGSISPAPSFISLSNAGRIEVGLPIGTLNLRGFYFQTGTLEIQLAGNAPGSGYDVLATQAGTAYLLGPAEVSLLNGFVPASSDTFTFFTAGSINQAQPFTNMTGGTYTIPEGEFDVVTTPTSVSLTNFRSAYALGDFDLSGATTNADIQAMLDALVDLEGYQAAHGLSDSGLKLVGDLDGSGAVTNADIQAMLDYLTGQSGMSAREISLQLFGDQQYLDDVVSSVPEPGTWLIIGANLVILLRRRGK